MLKITSILCLGAMFSLAGASYSVHGEELCAVGWKSFRQHCYRIQITEQTWSKSRDDCIASQSELVKLIDQSELEFVYNNFVRPLHGQSAWIGLSKVDGVFRWQDNSTITFKNWNFGEPNNYNGEEKCVELYVKSGQWNDIQCSKLRPSICKKGYHLRHPENLLMTSLSNLDFALRGHVTAVYNVSDVLECSRRCFQSPACYSVNYEYQHVNSTCELNNSTRAVARDSYIRRPGFIYYD